jgi:hypothetical protein
VEDKFRRGKIESFNSFLSRKNNHKNKIINGGHHKNKRKNVKRSI